MVLWDLVADAARRVADEVQRSNPTSKGFVYAVDGSKPKDVAEAAARVQEEAGFVAILINNAVRAMCFYPPRSWATPVLTQCVPRERRRWGRVHRAS